MRLSCRLTIAAALALASAAYSQNLIGNPDFNTDITAWTSSGTGGSAAWESGSGSPAPGSARLIAAFAGSLVTRSLTQCVTIPAVGNYDLIARTFTNSSIGNAGNEVRVTFFGAASCTGGSIGPFPTTALAPAGAWVERSSVNAAMPFGTVSALVELYVDSGTQVSPQSQSDVLFDNVRFGPTGTVPVELTGFTVE